MFNKSSRSRISDFSEIFVEIIRDTVFFTTGKLSTDVEGRIVPITEKKYIKNLGSYPPGIVAVICARDLVGEIPRKYGVAVSDDPSRALYLLHCQLAKRQGYFWEDFDSIVSSSATVHESAYVSKKNVVIGDNVVISPNVTVMERSLVGPDSFIGANSVVGSEAYEIITFDDRDVIYPQSGGVRIGSGVVILSGVTISRSVFPLYTEIGDYCSFDNNVHVAHDCKLSEKVKMAAAATLCGRVTIGKEAFIAPNATVCNGVSIGRRAQVTLGSVVIGDVEEGMKVTGNFAVDHKLFMNDFKKIR